MDGNLEHSKYLDQTIKMKGLRILHVPSHTYMQLAEIRYTENRSLINSDSMNAQKRQVIAFQNVYFFIFARVE